MYRGLAVLHIMPRSCTLCHSHAHYATLIHGVQRFDSCAHYASRAHYAAVVHIMPPYSVQWFGSRAHYVTLIHGVQWFDRFAHYAAVVHIMPP